MKALSVRAPWWWFILHAGKDIENRDWPTRFRGTVYLHAGKWFGKEEILDDYYSMRATVLLNADLPRVTLDDWKSSGGCLVGMVDIVDCVSKSDSPWFFGKYGFVLRNPRPLPAPIPFKGQLGFFEVPVQTSAE